MKKHDRIRVRSRPPLLMIVELTRQKPWDISLIDVSYGTNIHNESRLYVDVARQNPVLSIMPHAGDAGLEHVLKTILAMLSMSQLDECTRLVDERGLWHAMHGVNI